MVQTTAEMLEEEQRRLHAICIAPATIGEAISVELDETRGCGEVGVCHDVLLVLLTTKMIIIIKEVKL